MDQEVKEFVDVTRVCRDCSSDFVFSASDQKFFKSMSFVPPKRCPACRKRARANQALTPVTPDYDR